MKKIEFVNKRNNIYILVLITFILINAGVILFRINKIYLFLSILGLIFMVYTTIQALLFGRKIIKEVDNKINH